MDLLRAVRAASLDQRHLSRRVFGQASGEHAAGRTGADDDIVGHDVSSRFFLAPAITRHISGARAVMGITCRARSTCEAAVVQIAYFVIAAVRAGGFD